MNLQKRIVQLSGRYVLVQKLLRFIPQSVKRRYSTQPPLFEFSEGVRIWCNRAWDTAAILCDGSVVCHCFDPHGQKILGNINDQSFMKIWNNSAYFELRDSLVKGGNNFCRKCPAAYFLNTNEKPSRNPVSRIPPKILFIEPTVMCNLSCKNEGGCGTGFLRSRRRKLYLDFESIQKTIKNIGFNKLEVIMFFYYGEPLLNKNLSQMIAYARLINPKAFITLHTNGTIKYSTLKIESLYKSGIDEIVFSVDGGSSETYLRYRVGGNFDLALSNMKKFVEIRKKQGLKAPSLLWKYILFKWNDSDREMQMARSLGEQIGIDHLNWQITSGPPGAPSERFRPDAKGYDLIKHELYSMNWFGEKDIEFWQDQR